MTLGQERRSRGSGDFADLEGGEIGVSLFDGFGVCLALVLVRDLTRSARWYCERASLRFIREFTGDGAVRGAVLHDQDADFGIVLQDDVDRARGRGPAQQPSCGARRALAETVQKLAGRFGTLGLDPRGPGHRPGRDGRGRGRS